MLSKGPNSLGESVFLKLPYWQLIVNLLQAGIMLLPCFAVILEASLLVLLL
jgi:hypothetical protein